MEQHLAYILGGKGHYICEDKEYKAVYKTESGKIMENRPFISVVMPVYNAEKYLVSSIESVLNQSFHDLELILVNDCSTDGSSAICKDYLCRDARVKYIELTKNVGAGNTRNAGVETARGVYLAFIDADDTIELDLYQKAVDASCDGSLDLIVWGATECYYGKNGCLSSKNAIQGTPCVLNEDSQIARMALELEQKTLLGYQWNKLYKREIVENEHIRFEKSVLYEDFFFSLSVLNHVNSMAVIESAGYYYNKRFEGSITNKYVFVNSCLKDLCCILDDSITLGHINCLRKLKSFRHEYINSSNPEIYRSVDNHNKFKYIIDNQIEYGDYVRDLITEIKADKYFLDKAISVLDDRFDIVA